MVHARMPDDGPIELWLGESKLYKNTSDAIADAITSVTDHLNQGFLTQQKLILGPQIPRTTPRREEILELFQPQSSLDKFVNSSVFVIGIMSNSKACVEAQLAPAGYLVDVRDELIQITDRLTKSGLTNRVRIVLIYIPLADKEAFVDAFDAKLKALQ